MRADEEVDRGSENSSSGVRAQEMGGPGHGTAAGEAGHAQHRRAEAAAVERG